MAPLHFYNVATTATLLLLLTLQGSSAAPTMRPLEEGKKGHFHYGEDGKVSLFDAEGREVPIVGAATACMGCGDCCCAKKNPYDPSCGACKDCWIDYQWDCDWGCDRPIPKKQEACCPQVVNNNNCNCSSNPSLSLSLGDIVNEISCGDQLTQTQTCVANCAQTDNDCVQGCANDCPQDGCTDTCNGNCSGMCSPTGPICSPSGEQCSGTCTADEFSVLCQTCVTACVGTCTSSCITTCTKTCTQSCVETCADNCSIAFGACAATCAPVQAPVELLGGILRKTTDKRSAKK